MTWFVRLIGVLVLAASMVAPTPAGAEPYGVMTVTLVRHAESQANADGVIATDVPGPPLTALGRTQSKQAAQRMSESGFDAVFSSPLQRARQTAQYLADELGDTVQIQDGLREIEGGIYEGQPVAEAGGQYFQPIDAWIHGDRFARIPGSIDGNEFDTRFTSALAAISSSGSTHPVVYSHGGAIAAWTMMNVDNPPATNPGLGNTGYVVVRGNPNSGWTLVDWVPQP